jgi:hypothetical protein
MDVEGFEHKVLLGAEKFFQKLDVRGIIMEWNCCMLDSAASIPIQRLPSKAVDKQNCPTFVPMSITFRSLSSLSSSITLFIRWTSNAPFDLISRETKSRSGIQLNGKGDFGAIFVDADNVSDLKRKSPAFKGNRGQSVKINTVKVDDILDLPEISHTKMAPKSPFPLSWISICSWVFDSAL